MLWCLVRGEDVSKHSQTMDEGSIGNVEVIGIDVELVLKIAYSDP